MSYHGCKKIQTCVDGLIFCAGLEKSSPEWMTVGV